MDKGTQLYQLVQVAFALRHPETTTVPIGSEPLLAVGDVVIWDHTQATRLFDAMKQRHPGAEEPADRLQARRRPPELKSLSGTVNLRHFRPLRTPVRPSYHASNYNPLVAMARRWV